MRSGRRGGKSEADRGSKRKKSEKETEADGVDLYVYMRQIEKERAGESGRAARNVLETMCTFFFWDELGILRTGGT